jgi:hypothetical protein
MRCRLTIVILCTCLYKTSTVNVIYARPVVLHHIRIIVVLDILYEPFATPPSAGLVLALDLDVPTGWPKRRRYIVVHSKNRPGPSKSLDRV